MFRATGVFQNLLISRASAVFRQRGKMHTLPITRKLKNSPTRREKEDGGAARLRGERREGWNGSGCFVAFTGSHQVTQVSAILFAAHLVHNIRDGLAT